MCREALVCSAPLREGPACPAPDKSLALLVAAPAQGRHKTDLRRPQELTQSHFAGIFTHKHKLSKCSGADSKLCRKGTLLMDLPSKGYSWKAKLSSSKDRSVT